MLYFRASGFKLRRAGGFLQAHTSRRLSAGGRLSLLAEAWILVPRIAVRNFYV